MSTDDQQKRGGLVPIGDVAVRLPGIEGRGRAMSARARHHFTLLKQVNQLIEAGEGEPISGSWRGCWRCVLCRAPIHATGFSTSAATAHTSSA